MRLRIHPAVTMSVACALTVAGLVRATWAWRDTLRPLATGQLTLDEREIPKLASWIATPRSGGASRMVLLSDSLAICHDSAYVAPLVESSLGRMRLRASVLPIVHPGMRPSTFFFFADRLAEGRPRVVMIEVNPRAFEHDDAASSADPEHAAVFAAFGFHNLSRFLSSSTALRWPAALSIEGLTPLDPWIYAWQDENDLLYVADGLRTWIRQQVQEASIAIGESLGISDRGTQALHVMVRTDMYPPLAARRSARAYALDYASHPSARVLRELRDALVGRGIAVQFYVPPLNLEGVRNETGDQSFDRGLAERLAALREAIGARPEEWLDLHDAASPEVFADFASHMDVAGCELVADKIARRLVSRFGVPPSGVPRPAAPTASR